MVRRLYEIKVRSDKFRKTIALPPFPIFYNLISAWYERHLFKEPKNISCK